METRRGVSFQHPEILVHADLVDPALTEPYYWKLPGQFKGSMVGRSEAILIQMPNVLLNPSRVVVTSGDTCFRSQLMGDS